MDIRYNIVLCCILIILIVPYVGCLCISKLVRYFKAENVKPEARIWIYYKERHSNGHRAIAIYGTLTSGLKYFPIGTEVLRCQNHAVGRCVHRPALSLLSVVLQIIPLLIADYL